MLRVLLVGCAVCCAVCLVSCGNVGTTGTSRVQESASESKTIVSEKKNKTPIKPTAEKPKDKAHGTSETPTVTPPTATGPTARERWVTAGSPSLNLTNLKSGDLGVMPVGVINYKATGPNEAPTQPDLWRAGWVEKRPTGWNVLQVLDKDNALMTHIGGYYEKELNGETFWFEMNTSNLVDGRQTSLTGVWECKGTRRYTAAFGGPKTVVVLSYCGATTDKMPNAAENPMLAKERWLAYWMESWAADDVKPNNLKQPEWDARVQIWKGILAESLTGGELTVRPDGQDETLNERIQRNAEYQKLFKASKLTKQQFANLERRMANSLLCHLVKKSNEDLDRVDDRITHWIHLLLKKIRE